MACGADSGGCMSLFCDELPGADARHRALVDPALPGLRRVISLPLLVLYGLGTIVGAGIYVLLGEVAGLAGYQTPLAFLFAVLLALSRTLAELAALTSLITLVVFSMVNAASLVIDLRNCSGGGSRLRPLLFAIFSAMALVLSLALLYLGCAGRI